MEGKFILIFLVSLMIFPSIVTGHGGEESHEQGSLIDVIVIDLNCSENQTCVNRPTNFVEYFGADWCTNCPEVEQIIQNLDTNESLVISHRPSTQDDFWLSKSRFRFLDTYGLWGYPSVILDGHYLYAGPTQTQDISNKISEYNSNYSGISNVELVNNSLNISGSIENLSIDVWTVNSTNSLLNLAVNYTNLTDSNIVDIEGDKLIITLSKAGFIKLVPGSNIPANDYNPDIRLGDSDESLPQIKSSTVIIITILLLMITLPSLLQLFRLMKENDNISAEQE